MGAFKLGKMTFGSLFKKPETLMYPLESKPQPAGLKGRIVIDAPECILCGMCERSCSTGCLTVDKEASTWAIDRFACVQCGYCITVCPKKCLNMNPNYAPASVDRYHERFLVGDKFSSGNSLQSIEKVAADTPVIVDTPEPKAANAKPVSSVDEAAAHTPAVELDDQVAALVGLMDEQSADKVRKALA